MMLYPDQTVPAQTVYATSQTILRRSHLRATVFELFSPPVFSPNNSIFSGLFFTIITKWLASFLSTRNNDCSRVFRML